MLRVLQAALGAKGRQTHEMCVCVTTVAARVCAAPGSTLGSGSGRAPLVVGCEGHVAACTHGCILAALATKRPVSPPLLQTHAIRCACVPPPSDVCLVRHVYGSRRAPIALHTATHISTEPWRLEENSPIVVLFELGFKQRIL